MDEDRCMIKNCAGSSNLFCSPSDNDILKKWQLELDTKETSFSICDKHFSLKDISIAKCLKPSAIPSLKVSDHQTKLNDDFCGLCLENIIAEKFKILKQSSDNFKEITGFKPAKEHMCELCKKFIENYNHFKTYVKEKHKSLRTIEQLNESDEDCVVIAADESKKSLPQNEEEESSKVIYLKLPSEIVSELKVVDDNLCGKNMLRCKHCYYKTPDRNSLNKHIDEEHYFPCDKCPFISSNDVLLTLHNSKTHSANNSNISCCICDEQFKNRDEFYKHYETVHTSESCSYFMCFYCKENYETAKELEDHYRHLHNNCRTSAKDQITNTKLQLALLVVNKEMLANQAKGKRYDEMVQKFGSSVTVKKLSDVQKKLKKKVTKMRDYNPSEFELPINTPIKIAKNNVTKMRDYNPFGFELPINTPIKIAKNFSELRPKQKITEVTIVSSKENSKFIQESVECHEKEMQNENSDEEMIAEIVDDTICIDSDSDDVQDVTPTKKPVSSRIKIINSESLQGFRCLSCSKQFDNIPSLLEHREKFHPPEKKSYEEIDLTKFPPNPHKKLMENDGYNRVNCDICGVLVQERYLQKHKDLRHSEKQLLCHLCSEAFSDNTRFRYHMMKHEPEKLLQCDMCDKGYCTKGRLIRHIKRSHLRIAEVRAQCSICKKKLYKNIKNCNALKSHMNKYHPDGKDDGYRVNEETNYFDCEKCGASYWDLYTFTRHNCDKGKLQLRCLDCMTPCANQESLHRHKLTKCKKINPFLNSISFKDLRALKNHP